MTDSSAPSGDLKHSMTFETQWVTLTGARTTKLYTT